MSNLTAFQQCLVILHVSFVLIKYFLLIFYELLQFTVANCHKLVFYLFGYHLVPCSRG